LSVDCANPWDGGDRGQNLVAGPRLVIEALQSHVEAVDFHGHVLEVGPAERRFGLSLDVPLDGSRPEQHGGSCDEEEDHHGAGHEGDARHDLVVATGRAERGWWTPGLRPVLVGIQLLEPFRRRPRHRAISERNASLWYRPPGRLD
jgi:hypothetical protein